MYLIAAESLGKNSTALVLTNVSLGSDKHQRARSDRLTMSISGASNGGGHVRRASSSMLAGSSPIIQEKFLGIAEPASSAREEGITVMGQMDSTGADKDFYRTRPDWFAVDVEGTAGCREAHS